VPAAVRREVYGLDPLPEWLEERRLAQPLASRIVGARLGAGEREAIALALEISADELVLDDLAARRLAHSLGISLIGSLGLLLRAKTRGLIPSVRPLLEAMQANGFRVAARVVEGMLRAAGE
jgi:predicted nucleic acid-binding protein